MSEPNRFAGLCTAAIALFLLSGCGASPEALPPAALAADVSSRDYARPRNDVPGVRNFAKVSDGLFRGAQPTRRGFRELEKMGIRTVVSVRRRSSDDDLLKGTSLRYFHVSCEASRPEHGDVLQFLKIVTDPANQPVFVHCRRGADRTGYLIACYRMLQQGWSAADARAEMSHFRYNPLWWKLARYVRGFDPEGMREWVAATSMPEFRSAN